MWALLTTVVLLAMLDMVVVRKGGNKDVIDVWDGNENDHLDEASMISSGEVVIKSVDGLNMDLDGY